MIVETATFRLVPGVGEHDFLKADRRVQTEVVPNLPGFLRRTTARGNGGEWIVLTLWGSEEEALAAEELGATDPAVRGFTELIETASFRSARYHTLD